MHKLAEFSLANRALIALVTLASLLFGGIAMTSLRTELTPDIELPVVVVAAQYQGASPEVIANEVTDPIERAMQAVPGLVRTEGTSSQGLGLIQAEFEYGVNLATTEQRVQQAVNRISGVFPRGVETQVLTASIGDLPILQLTVAIGDGDKEELADRLRVEVIPTIERLSGVRQVTLEGAEGRRVEVIPDQQKLAAAGLSAGDLADVIGNAGEVSAAGTIDQDDMTYSVQLGAQLEDEQAIAALPLAPDVTVADVASVKIVPSPESSIAVVNGQPAVTLSITKSQDANTVEVSHAVRDLIPQLQARLGEEHPITVVFDQAPFIEESISSLGTEGLMGLGMAVLVILIFLFSIRSTLVAAISIPASLLLSFIALWFADYTLNVLTLGALTIAIGRVVDDSIVVVENIRRHLEFEPDRGRAILDAVREVAGAITASTLTTMVVFLPITFVSGVAGELFGPFAMTSAFALAASLFVSLTIVPVLSYWFLRSDADKAEAPQAIADADDAAPDAGAAEVTVNAGAEDRDEAVLAEVADGETGAEERTGGSHPARSAVTTAEPSPRAIETEEGRGGRLQRGYGAVLRPLLRHPVLTTLAAALVFAASLGLAPLLGVTLFGSTGQTAVQLTQEVEPGLSLDERREIAIETSEMVQGVEGVEIVGVRVAGDGPDAVFAGRDRIPYSVTAEDGADMERVEADIRSATEGAAYEVHFGQQGFDTSTLEVALTSADPKALREAAELVVERLKDVPELAQITSDLAIEQPLVRVDVNRGDAAALGLTESQIVQQVEAASVPAPIGLLQMEGAELVIYLTPAEPPATVDELQNLQIMTAGGPRALSELAEVRLENAPANITTRDANRSITVSAESASADIGEANSALQAAIADLELPRGVEWGDEGAYAEIVDAFTQLAIAALVAIILVYIVMVATFKSLLQPFLLLISIPFAATGAIIAQLIAGIPVGVPTLVGVLMLIGIVVTNAIVLVDLINQYRARGLSVQEAVPLGAQRRLRPILMTAAATIFALIPMALGLTGQGGFISQPLAVVVIGGLVSSTLLTLVVLPALYLAVEGWRERRKARKRA